MDKLDKSVKVGIAGSAIWTLSMYLISDGRIVV